MHPPRIPTAVSDCSRGRRLSTLRAILTGEGMVPPRPRLEGRQGPPRLPWRALTTLRAGETTYHPLLSLEVPRAWAASVVTTPAGRRTPRERPGSGRQLTPTGRVPTSRGTRGEGGARRSTSRSCPTGGRDVTVSEPASRLASITPAPSWPRSGGEYRTVA